MALQRMLCGAISSATLWHVADAAELARGVGGIGGAAFLAGLGIDLDDRAACCGFMTRQACFMTRKLPNKFTFITARHFSASASAIGSAIRMAALATTMSTRPNSCTAPVEQSPSPRLPASRPLSCRQRDGPSPWRSRRPCPSRPASFMSAMATLQPSRASRSEMAWPSPCAPPVTMAILSFKSSGHGSANLFSNASSASLFQWPSLKRQPRCPGPSAAVSFRSAAGRIDDDFAGHQVLFDGADAVDRAVQTGIPRRRTNWCRAARDTTFASTLFMSSSVEPLVPMK